MLPGLRFLFATVVIAVSVVIFGLGAAALLRSAHDDFASLPNRQLAPANDPKLPMLALLRLDPTQVHDRIAQAAPALDSVSEPEISTSGGVSPDENASDPRTADAGAPALPRVAALSPATAETASPSPARSSVVRSRARSLKAIRLARAKARQRLLAKRRAQATLNQRDTSTNPFAGIFVAP